MVQLLSLHADKFTREWVDIGFANSTPTISSLRALSAPPDAAAYSVLGYYTNGDGGGGLFYWNATDTRADDGGTIIAPNGVSTGRWNRVFDTELNVLWFGAKGDGVTDDSAAFNAATIAASASGYTGILIVPGGKTYLLANQWIVSAPGLRRLFLIADGAIIITSGAISGVQITGGNNSGGLTLRGLHILHRGNAQATAGFDIVGAWHTTLEDCTVEASGVSASYAAFLVRSKNPADDSTGSFWTRIIRPTTRKRTGGDIGAITKGIVLRGAANATEIQGGLLADCTTSLSIEVDTGQTTLANAVLVHAVDFESYTTAVNVNGAATSNIAGYRFFTNRFENGTTVFSFTGTTTQPSVPAFMCGNYLVSSAGTYLNNPNNIQVNALDFSLTPALGAIGASIKADLTVTATLGSTNPITAVTLGGNRGYILNKSDGTTILEMLWIGVANQSRIRGNTGGTPNLALTGIQGISGSGASTDRNNLRGTVQISGNNTSAAVAFSVNEPDAAYLLSVAVTDQTGTPATGSTRAATKSKATTGFTIILEAAPGVGNSVTVDWILIG